MMTSLSSMRLFSRNQRLARERLAQVGLAGPGATAARTAPAAARPHHRHPSIGALIALACACTAGPTNSFAAERPPPPSAPKSFQLPTPQTIELPNGLQATFISFGVVPKVRIAAVVRAGSLNAGRQTWLPQMTGDFLKEGTAKRSAVEVSEAAADMGGSVDVSIGDEQSIVGMDVLSEKSPAAVELLAEILTQPKLPESELSRIRQNYLRNLSLARNQPQTLASSAFATLLYGEHPFGRTLPTEQQLNDYSIDDVRRFYGENFGAQRTHIYVAGKFERASLEQAIRTQFSTWNRGPAALLDPPKPARQLQVTLIDRPGAPQSTLRLGIPVIGPENDEFMPLSVMNTLLGGALTSRITSNLRESKGWAYSPNSGLPARYRDTVWMESADVTTAHTAEAIGEIFHEIERLRTEQPTDPKVTTQLTTELTAIKNYRNGLFGLSNASRSGLLSQLVFMDLHGLPLDWLSTYVQRLYAVTPAQVSAAAGRLDEKEMSLVVVGDMAKIRTAIKALPQLKGATINGSHCKCDSNQ